MKKKILAIFPSIYLYGKERSNIEVFRILDSNPDISLKILANKALAANLKKEIQDFDITYCAFPSRTNTKFRYIKYLYKFIGVNLRTLYYILKMQPEMIYLNNEMSVYDLFPIWLLCKSKLIYRIGDIPAYPSLSGYKLNSYLWNAIVVNRIDTIVSISKFIKNEIEKTGRHSPKDLVIYNFPPFRKGNIIASTPAESNTLTIGYLGQIRELKGVHVLLEAIVSFLKQGHNIRLVLAGDPTLFPDYSEKLYKVIKANHLENSISFIGEIEDISVFFKEINILCVPTLWPEALGNVLVEAKQHHKPLIIFPSGGMPELVNHKIDGYVCKDKTPEALIEAFTYYIEHPYAIISQGENSYKSLQHLGIVKDEFVHKWKTVFELI